MTAPPEAAGGAADESLSREVLDELRTVGGDGLVRDLMEVFVECTPDRLRRAGAAHAAGDLEGCAAALHSLRSAAGTIGARRLADQAGRLERAARGSRDGELAAGLDELRREAETVLAAARALSERGSAP